MNTRLEQYSDGAPLSKRNVLKTASGSTPSLELRKTPESHQGPAIGDVGSPMGAPTAPMGRGGEAAMKGGAHLGLLRQSSTRTTCCVELCRNKPRGARPPLYKKLCLTRLSWRVCVCGTCLCQRRILRFPGGWCVESVGPTTRARAWV